VFRFTGIGSRYRVPCIFQPRTNQSGIPQRKRKRRWFEISPAISWHTKKKVNKMMEINFTVIV
jgi:hypothetical protein